MPGGQLFGLLNSRQGQKIASHPWGEPEPTPYGDVQLSLGDMVSFLDEMQGGPPMRPMAQPQPMSEDDVMIMYLTHMLGKK